MIVNFPEKIWGRLASIADNRGVSIAEVIVEAAGGLLHSGEAVAQKTAAPATPPFDPDDESVIARVRELHELGWSRVNIAQEVGTTFERIRPLCERLGLAPRHYSHPRKVDDGWFRELYDLGWTDEQIAARMGVADVTIGRARRRLGLPSLAQRGRPMHLLNTNPKEDN